MQTDRRFCVICAWRETCQKRFIERGDKSDLNCIDYTRDVTIKDFDKLMVDFQLEKWKDDEKRRGRPVITISRQSGSGGSEIARILANDLKMDLIGGQIINKVAASARMSAKVVSSLDEKVVSRLDDFINSIFESRHLWPDVYLKHLTEVILTIGEHGNSVIMGRGAQFILPAEKIFRVRIIAPREVRIKRIMERGLTRGEAEKYIDTKDSNRAGFIQKYFHEDTADPANYDLVVNTEKLGIEGSVEAIKKSFLDHWTAGKPLVPRISESFAPAKKMRG